MEAGLFFCTNPKCVFKPNQFILGYALLNLSRRYRCLECNVVLCTNCFDTLQHREHIMQQISGVQDIFNPFLSTAIVDFQQDCASCEKLIVGPYCFCVTNEFGRKYLDAQCFYEQPKTDAVHVIVKPVALCLTLTNLQKNLSHVSKVLKARARTVRFDKNFYSELAAARCVFADNVVQLSAFSPKDQLFFYPQHETLKNFLLSTPHAPPMSTFISFQLAAGIANGLAAFHRMSWLHRNLSTNTILITLNGNIITPMLSDFGFVKKSLNQKTSPPKGSEGVISRAWQFNAEYWWSLDLNQL